MSKESQKKYFHMTKTERASIERKLDSESSARSMAKDLGRAPSVVAEEWGIPCKELSFAEDKRAAEAFLNTAAFPGELTYSPGTRYPRPAAASNHSECTRVYTE